MFVYTESCRVKLIFNVFLPKGLCGHDLGHGVELLRDTLRGERGPRPPPGGPQDQPAKTGAEARDPTAPAGPRKGLQVRHRRRTINQPSS